MKKSYRPNRFDFDAVSPETTVMHLGDEAAKRDVWIEKRDETDAAAEEAEESEENTQVAEAAKHNGARL